MRKIRTISTAFFITVFLFIVVGNISEGRQLYTTYDNAIDTQQHYEEEEKVEPPNSLPNSASMHYLRRVKGDINRYLASRGRPKRANINGSTRKKWQNNHQQHQQRMTMNPMISTSTNTASARTMAAPLFQAATIRTNKPTTIAPTPAPTARVRGSRKRWTVFMSGSRMRRRRRRRKMRKGKRSMRRMRRRRSMMGKSSSMMSGWKSSSRSMMRRRRSTSLSTSRGGSWSLSTSRSTSRSMKMVMRRMRTRRPTYLPTIAPTPLLTNFTNATNATNITNITIAPT